jgi:hypothetical protein
MSSERSERFAVEVDAISLALEPTWPSPASCFHCGRHLNACTLDKTCGPDEKEGPGQTAFCITPCQQGHGTGLGKACIGL